MKVKVLQNLFENRFNCIEVPTTWNNGVVPDKLRPSVRLIVIVNLYHDENTIQKTQKQNLILLPETHTVYYKELHTDKGLLILHKNERNQ